MKFLYSVLAVAMLLATSTSSAQAAVHPSVDFFYDNLEPYGDWREVGDLGYCWQPRDVERDWRPYSEGRWLYTDAGWTWDSDEPYSWAVYHYGRWARVDRIGWVWVPGTEWGPAWVSWRYSSRHVGWAPLPPEARFTRSVGFSSRVDAEFGIGPTNYNFVEVRNFGAPRLRTVIIEPRDNITIIRQTTNITRITYVNSVVYNEGPQYDLISRESAQPIRRLKLERREEFDGDPATLRAEQLRTTVAGDSLRVVAFPFGAKAAAAPRKLAERVKKPEVDRGWKDAGPPAEVAKLRTQIKSEPVKPAERPPTAPPVTDDQPAKGKVRAGVKETRPAAPIKTEVAPPPPEKPEAPDRTARPDEPAKPVKPVKPEPNRVPPSPPPLEEPAPTSVFKKGKNKGVETPRPPAEAVPQERVPERKPKRENIETIPKPQPTAVEEPRQKNHPGKEDVRPKVEQPAIRDIERNVPNNPEPSAPGKKGEPRQKVVPVVTEPQPPQPTHEKGKGKSKKEDDGKPEEAPR